MKTRTVWLTETVEYRFAVDVETDDDNEAIEKAQRLFDECTADEANGFVHDVSAVDWFVEETEALRG